MDKLGLLRERNPLLLGQFQKSFIGTQAAAIGGILNLVFFGNNLVASSNSFFFRFDLLALAIGVIVTAFLYIKLDSGKDTQVVTAFLWLWTVIMAAITWFEGGLYSPLLLSFPIILICAALFTELLAFLCICFFLSAAVIFMGSNHLYSWFLPPDGMSIEGVSRIISTLVLTTLSGYVCWVFASLLKRSFEDLRQENLRVIESQKVIKKLAGSDPLTGLLNRDGASSSYQRLLSTLDFNHDHLFAYFIDLDNFKSINDLFDHQAGDKLLVTMSHRLQEFIDGNGFVCRFGGDEFVLILQTNRSFNAEAFADNILISLAQPHSILGTEAEVTASIGIAVADDSQTSFDSLCKKADLAMYKAKHSGKNKYHLYSDELQREYMRNLHIVDRLKNALSKGLLDLHYQPKVNLISNRAEGAEALLRWKRENPENIGPEEFIPIIESTDLIHSIGAWVINEACMACKKWQEEGKPLRVAVNVSALQLNRSEFYQIVLDALKQSDLPPAMLEIEITEHSVVQEAAVVKMQLEALKNLGVRLAIDDFGTGYSNMGYLTRLQIDSLKLDRSFVSEITNSNEHRVIVTAIIKMAKVLGMKVVAEGIETERERDVLKDLDCDFGQGFFWSQAVQSTELLGIIDQGFENKVA